MRQINTLMFKNKDMFKRNALKLVALGAMAAIAASFTHGLRSSLREAAADKEVARILSNNSETPLRMLFGDNWDYVCAASQTIGLHIAKSSREQAAMAALRDKVGLFANEANWYLAVFSKETTEPVVHVLNRRKVPFTDGPFLVRHLEGRLLSGTAVLCTADHSSRIVEVLSPNNNNTLTLVE